MAQQELVSVLIPVYNAGVYLQEAVLSVINQTYTNLEIIIIDDGSTDDCISFISDFNDPRIILISQENGGKSVALNRAMDTMKGEYFIIQDADDKSYHNRINVLLKVLSQNYELAAVYSGHDLILDNKQFAPTFQCVGIKKCDELNDAYKMPAHDPTGMYKVKLVGDMRFDESLRIGQGVDFVLRVGEKFPMLCVGECLYSYRINFNSTIRKNIDNTKNSVNIVKQKAYYRRGLDLNDLKIPREKKKIFFNGHKLEDDIISHCMESVIQQKNSRMFQKAFDVGWQCFILHPLDPYYSKPLIYVLTPLKLIYLYREFKLRLF